jgi:sugar lactone lactonase YvrE
MDPLSGAVLDRLGADRDVEGPDDLSFGPDGALYEVDPSGANPPRLIAQGLGGLNAMDWGADGLLYGPLSFAGQVVRINVDSGVIAPVPGGFGLPTAANFDSRGRLYVVDQRSVKGRGEVVRVDLGSGRKTVIARLTAGRSHPGWGPNDSTPRWSFG